MTSSVVLRRVRGREGEYESADGRFVVWRRPRGWWVRDTGGRLNWEATLGTDRWMTDNTTVPSMRRARELINEVLAKEAT